MQQAALLTVHRMGATPRDYAEKLFEAVAARPWSTTARSMRGGAR
ncbi:hypothetical protein ACI48D_04655 [Massilia sp. LXY-6]